MTAKKTEADSKYVTIDGEEYETISVEYHGKTYIIRELGVKENDDIETASTDKDKEFNGKLNLRLSLAAAIVSPDTTVDQIEKWPGKKYVTISRAFNKISTVSDESGVPNA